MFSSQKISERLRETLRFFQPKPPTLFIRLWQAFNGYVPFAFIALWVSFARFDSAFLVHAQEGSTDPFNLFFIIGSFTTCFPIYHLATGRKDYVRVSESVISAAVALENQVNHKQMQHMTKTTRLTRKLIGSYVFETFTNIFMAFALWYYSAGAQKSFFPFGPLYFQLEHFVELFIIHMGISSGAAMLLYHVEISICLACMYNVVGELFLEVCTRESLNELIRIHQLLLHASKILQQTFSIQWFAVLFTYLLTITVSTYITVWSLSLVTWLWFSSRPVCSCLCAEFVLWVRWSLCRVTISLMRCTGMTGWT